MSQRFAVVHEAEADFRTATELADRVLRNAIEWLDEFLIEGQREWVGTVPIDRRLTWAALTKLARQMDIRSRGYFDDQPAKPDAVAASLVIQYLRRTIPDLKVILLIRDQDDQPGRRHGLEQARQQHGSSVRILVGLAVVERECWVLCGFEPVDADEKELLAFERRKLGFDPRIQSHQLTACKDDTAKRSPKRVLRVLSGDARERERHCWMNTSLDLLRERGRENGLTAFLDEIRDHLVPLMVRE